MTEEKKIYPQLKYYRKMYKNNEEFTLKKKERSLDYYNSIREEQIKRYEEDEEYRKKRAEIARKCYLKRKAKKAEEEAKKALPLGSEDALVAPDEVHIAENS